MYGEPPPSSMINMESFMPEIVSARRETNKIFMECLVEFKMGRGPAIVWLKKNVDFDICNVILSDVNYSCSWIQILMDMITQKKKLLQKFFAEKIKGDFFLESHKLEFCFSKH